MFQEIGKATAVEYSSRHYIYIYILYIYIYLFAELARGEETRGETKIVLTFSDRC